MGAAIKKIISISIAAALCLGALATSAPALAGDGAVYKIAASEEKGYGAKKPVSTEKEARAALEEYYEGKALKVGEIEEKELYFEAEVLDKDGEVTDRVIIDKRTGRIRSIY
jgi:hypothetical protein